MFFTIYNTNLIPFRDFRGSPFFQCCSTFFMADNDTLGMQLSNHLLDLLQPHDPKVVDVALQLLVNAISKKRSKAAAYVSECPYRDDRKHVWGDAQRLFKACANCNMRFVVCVYIEMFGFWVVGSDVHAVMEQSCSADSQHLVTVQMSGAKPVCLSTNRETANILQLTRHDLRSLFMHDLTEDAQAHVDTTAATKRKSAGEAPRAYRQRKSKRFGESPDVPECAERAESKEELPSFPFVERPFTPTQFPLDPYCSPLLGYPDFNILSSPERSFLQICPALLQVRLLCILYTHVAHFCFCSSLPTHLQGFAGQLICAGRFCFPPKTCCRLRRRRRRPHRLIHRILRRRRRPLLRRRLLRRRLLRPHRRLLHPRKR